jgi:hypothetical protein
MNTQLSETLTIDDLIAAFVEQEQHKNWHRDLVNYYRKRLSIMQSLFGCELEKGRAELDAKKWRLNPTQVDRETWYEFNGKETVDLFYDCIRLIAETKTPFDYSGTLAGMPPKISRDLAEKYEQELGERIEKLEDTYRSIAKEILMYMFPGVETRQVSAKAVKEAGLWETEPDWTDYV